MTPDFFLEPDQLEPECPRRGRPVRLVSTGLHPTAAVPKGRAGKDGTPAYAPCLLCGQEVLSGEDLSGRTLHLDTTQPCYCVVWENREARPTFVVSRAYVMHQCAPGGCGVPS